MSNILIDTNILVYAKDASSIYHLDALSVLNERNSIFMTSKNLTEYYAVVTKGENPLLNPLDAWHDLEEFISFSEILYPNNVSQQILATLVSRYTPKGLKIHDFEIASIALAHGIKTIATFNGRDFKQIEGIEVLQLK